MVKRRRDLSERLDEVVDQVSEDLIDLKLRVDKLNRKLQQCGCKSEFGWEKDI